MAYRDLPVVALLRSVQRRMKGVSEDELRVALEAKDLAKTWDNADDDEFDRPDGSDVLVSTVTDDPEDMLAAALEDFEP